MSCPKESELVAYVDGELDINASEPIEAHLNACAACRGVVEAFAELNHFGRASFETIAISRNPVELDLPARPGVAWGSLAALVAGLLVLAWGLLNFPNLLNKPNTEVRVSEVEGPVETGHPNGETSVELSEQQRRNDDGEFERWAAPNRERRIPLIPLEEVVRHVPLEIDNRI